MAIKSDALREAEGRKLQKSLDKWLDTREQSKEQTRTKYESNTALSQDVQSRLEKLKRRPD